MNQILSVEMPNNKSKKNKSNISSVIIFFSVILIIFAIILVAIGIYFMTSRSKDNKNETENNTVIEQPSTTDGIQIDVQVENEAKIKIIVTHDKKISKISYKWNNEEPTEITNIDGTSAEIEVDVHLGTNTLTISATDIEGTTKETEPKEYTNNKDIMLVTEQIANTAKVTVESKTTISYISYNWDGGEEQQIQINDTKTEQILEISEGEHTLNIVAVDMQNHEIKDSKTFKGDNKPTLEITTDRKNFIITASDDEGLTKMVINLNGRNLNEIEINEKDYSTTIQLENVDARMMGNVQFGKNENGIVVSVYNVNGLVETQYIKAVKE